MPPKGEVRLFCRDMLHIHDYMTIIIMIQKKKPELLQKAVLLGSARILSTKIIEILYNVVITYRRSDICYLSCLVLRNLIVVVSCEI